MKMIDNYGEKVPADLVLMPDINQLSFDNIKLVVDAIWYDAIVGTDEIVLLCVSEEAIYSLSCDSLDAYDTPIIKIMRVNDVLKRWGEEDGFYHA